MSAAFAIFIAFVGVTLAITAWASSRAGSREQYYTAGSAIGGTANGFALAGDFLSAAAFLGVVGLYFAAGLDGLIYGLGALIGWLYNRSVRSARAERLGVLVASGMIVGESLFGVINAGIIVAANRDAPLAIVPAGFEFATLFGALGLAGVTALLYGWLLKRARTE